MGMLMTMLMAVGMAVIMVMVMPAAAIMAVIMVMTSMGMAACFRLEGTGDMVDLAALSPCHFSQHMVVLNIDGSSREFDWRMATADLPSHSEQSQGIVCLDFEQGFRCGPYGNQRSVLKFQSIAIVQLGGPFEVEKESRPLFALQHDALFEPPFVIERHGIDHPFWLDGRLADNAGGALHGHSLSDRNDAPL